MAHKNIISSIKKEVCAKTEFGKIKKSDYESEVIVKIIKVVAQVKQVYIFICVVNWMESDQTKLLALVYFDFFNIK